MLEVRRIGAEPIVHQAMDATLGANINGPSLVRVPDWAPGALGRYYLYFAHHEGRHIRLAVADALAGPWRIHRPGALHLRQTPLPQTPPKVPQPAWAVARGVDGLYPHIASPDVHLDHGARRWVMYLHGLIEDGDQASLTATSADGLDWQVAPRRIPRSYLRVFAHGGARYAMALGGELLRLEPDGSATPGPRPFPPGHRHAGVLVRGDTLHVFWTRIGDAPERIYHSPIALTGDWRGWRLGATAEVLRPELDWEGAGLPVAASQVGTADPRENALRDPFPFEDGARVYLVYAGAGEAALGLAEVTGI